MLAARPDRGNIVLKSPPHLRLIQGGLADRPPGSVAARIADVESELRREQAESAAQWLRGEVAKACLTVVPAASA